MTAKNHRIGHFMVAVGCVLEHEPSGKILCLKRDVTNYESGKWELMYGRIDQHEELFDGLKREVREETGVRDLDIKKLIRVWHIYRGEKNAAKEVHGFTFYCTTKTKDIVLSKEHSEFSWETPTAALKKVELVGIQTDIELYMKYKNSGQIAISGTDHRILSVL